MGHPASITSGMKIGERGAVSSHVQHAVLRLKSIECQFEIVGSRRKDCRKCSSATGLCAERVCLLEWKVWCYFDMSVFDRGAVAEGEPDNQLSYRRSFVEDALREGQGEFLGFS